MVDKVASDYLNITAVRIPQMLYTHIHFSASKQSSVHSYIGRGGGGETRHWTEKYLYIDLRG
jgi:hypothetical protein